MAVTGRDFILEILTALVLPHHLTALFGDILRHSAFRSLRSAVLPSHPALQSPSAASESDCAAQPASRPPVARYVIWACSARIPRRPADRWRRPWRDRETHPSDAAGGGGLWRRGVARSVGLWWEG